jgi:hypothetical protein
MMSCLRVAIACWTASASLRGTFSARIALSV